MAVDYTIDNKKELGIRDRKQVLLPCLITAEGLNHGGWQHPVAFLTAAIEKQKQCEQKVANPRPTPVRFTVVGATSP